MVAWEAATAGELAKVGRQQQAHRNHAPDSGRAEAHERTGAEDTRASNESHQGASGRVHRVPDIIMGAVVPDGRRRARVQFHLTKQEGAIWGDLCCVLDLGETRGE